MHKPFKDTYRRSNHVNATPQILNTYTRNHGFQLREKNIEAWANKIPLSQHILSVIRLTYTLLANIDTNLLKMHLQGQIDLKLIYSLESLAYEYRLSDLMELTLTFLHRNARQMADALSQATYSTEAFTCLRIAVPSFNGNGHIMHYLCCTGSREFHMGNIKRDWSSDVCSSDLCGTP